MGGMVYSNQYPKGNTDNSSLTQVIEWNEYVLSLPPGASLADSAVQVHW